MNERMNEWMNERTKDWCTLNIAIIGHFLDKALIGRNQSIIQPRFFDLLSYKQKYSTIDIFLPGNYHVTISIHTSMEAYLSLSSSSSSSPSSSSPLPQSLSSLPPSQSSSQPTAGFRLIEIFKISCKQKTELQNKQNSSGYVPENKEVSVQEKVQ